MTELSIPDATGSENPEALPDATRRKVLTAATAIVGGAGVAAASIPFIASMMPSERARAAGGPVDANFARLEPGQQLTVEWRGRPVWILRRTEAMLKTLEDPGHLKNLVDPDSKVRSQQP
ncbi:MAG: twin-arginine translocation signal domain-containing protein, partial [Betaproteobacteria bacterium]|nr:twin-arginine translocation signal domain-containing protein [Betaproteobacteria bacterium]